MNTTHAGNRSPHREEAAEPAPGLLPATLALVRRRPLLLLGGLLALGLGASAVGLFDLSPAVLAYAGANGN
jgi:hypothetical protein